MPEIIYPVVGFHIIYLEEVTSTNDLALRIAEEGAPEGLVVTAHRQTEGRGKQGRRWESVAGGLWISVILRPSNPTSHAPIFNMMGAVASAEAIREISGLEACVRWPNDLFLRGKKVGGVLCEMKGTETQIRYLVMGIGINVNQEGKDFSVRLRGLTTSLRLESGKVWDRGILAEALYDRLDFWYRSLQNQEMESFFLRLGQLSEGPGGEWGSLREMVRIA
jgi:BirA family biotin operon repressor/biotin-[acetyl-CoA-carboxylase] ligase